MNLKQNKEELKADEETEDEEETPVSFVTQVNDVHFSMCAFPQFFAAFLNLFPKLTTPQLLEQRIRSNQHPHLLQLRRHFYVNM